MNTNNIQYPETGIQYLSIPAAFFIASAEDDFKLTQSKGMFMNKILLVVMAFFMVQSTGGSRNAAAQAPDLSQYRWKNRLLLIFAPNRSHLLFDGLHQSLAARETEVADRDLVIFEIFESAPSSINKAVIDSDSAHWLRERFDVQPGKFTVVLIGKDGGIKLKRGDRTNLEAIFGLIDSMPMRREEMRQKSN